MTGVLRQFPVAPSFGQILKVATSKVGVLMIASEVFKYFQKCSTTNRWSHITHMKNYIKQIAPINNR